MRRRGCIFENQDDVVHNFSKSEMIYVGFSSLGKGNMIRNEKEQAMIEYLKKLRQNRTDMSLNQICHFLDTLDDPCRRKARRWHASTLHRIFINNNIPLPEEDEKRLEKVKPDNADNHKSSSDEDEKEHEDEKDED
jgi:hypothetical protein